MTACVTDCRDAKAFRFPCFIVAREKMRGHNRRRNQNVKTDNCDRRSGRIRKKQRGTLRRRASGIFVFGQRRNVSRDSVESAAARSFARGRSAVGRSRERYERHTASPYSRTGKSGRQESRPAGWRGGDASYSENRSGGSGFTAGVAARRSP